MKSNRHYCILNLVSSNSLSGLKMLIIVDEDSWLTNFCYNSVLDFNPEDSDNSYISKCFYIHLVITYVMYHHVLTKSVCL